MNKIPTAEELASGFFTKYSKEDCELSPECRTSTIYHERLAEAFKGYGKSLVKAALKAAAENADTDYICRLSEEEIDWKKQNNISLCDEDFVYVIDTKSILNAYPEDKIQ